MNPLQVNQVNQMLAQMMVIQETLQVLLESFPRDLAGEAANRIQTRVNELMQGDTWPNDPAVDKCATAQMFAFLEALGQAPEPPTT